MILEPPFKPFACHHCGRVLGQRVGNSLVVGTLEIKLKNSTEVKCDGEKCRKKGLGTFFHVNRRGKVIDITDKRQYDLT